MLQPEGLPADLQREERPRGSKALPAQRRQHEAWATGAYCFFQVNPSIHATRAFEVPVTAGVKFHDLLTVSLGGVGTIDHVINDTGAAAQGSSTIPVNVVGFP